MDLSLNIVNIDLHYIDVRIGEHYYCNVCTPQVEAVYVMGGNYIGHGLSWLPKFNFNCGKGFMGAPLECEGSAAAAVAGMPPEVRMVFSGFEAGVRVLTGAALTSCAAADNPCRQAYIDRVGEGRNRFRCDCPKNIYSAVKKYFL